MATETWWHGRTYCAARMGEAPKVTEWYGNGYVTANPVERSASKGSNYSQGSNALRSGSPQSQSRSARRLSGSCLLRMLLLVIFTITRPSTAAFVTFSNCMSPDIINSNPPQLQFVPLYVWATFNSSAASHNINVTAYGNVAGIATQQPYPAQNDSQWRNPNDTVGKIPDVAGPASHPLYTTFKTEFKVLDYTPYDPPAVRLCNSSSLTQCPLTPVFNFKGNE